MERYIGTKIITAKPMTLGAYNRYRGWDLPKNEKPLTKGYLIEYPASMSSPPNHVDHSGYISWSPKAVFEASYKSSGNWNFGQALEALKAGDRVQRKGWNGKGLFAYLVNGSTFTVDREPLSKVIKPGTKVTYRPHLDLKAVDGTFGVWVPSTSDLLADDWQLF